MTNRVRSSLIRRNRFIKLFYGRGRSDCPSTSRRRDHVPARIAPNIFRFSPEHRLSRLWEFHPDDVISVGIYRGDGQMHEVIATLNRDFDVPEATSGLKELNERLSRELNATLTIDVEHGSSPSGIVLWPPHLAGSPLWEFCVLGEDGLASYVAPGTPNAVRNLSHAVCREMARLAKHRLPDGLPKPLFDRGFIYYGKVGWYRDDAVMAAKWLHGEGATALEQPVGTMDST